MRVFIFGMTGPPRGWCVYSCLCVYVSERKICREEAHLWLLFRCIKIIYFKTAPRKVSVVIREALGHLAQKTDALVCANMPWKRQLFSASGYSWDPRQSGKAPPAHRWLLTLAWASSSMAKAGVQISRSPGSSCELRWEHVWTSAAPSVKVQPFR